MVDGESSIDEKRGEGSGGRERLRSIEAAGLGKGDGARSSSRGPSDDADGAEMRRGSGRTRLAGPAEIIPEAEGVDSWVDVAEEVCRAMRGALVMMRGEPIARGSNRVMRCTKDCR